MNNSLLPKMIFSEVVGGPHDGIICIRLLTGLYVDEVKITHLINGGELVGNMLMPGGLILYSGGKPHEYIRYCSEDFKKSRYLWEGLNV